LVDAELQEIYDTVTTLLIVPFDFETAAGVTSSDPLSI